MQNPHKPLYITSGEPAGIGPDICLDLAEREDPCPLVVLADLNLMQQRANILCKQINLIKYTGQTLPSARGSLYIEHIALAQPVQAGQLDVAHADYVMQQLQRSADYALTRCSLGVVTAPVQKSILNDAGIAFSGHTEFYQQQAGVDRVVMMLANHNLRVALVTTHLPLRDVADAITTTRLTQVIDILLMDLKLKFNLAQPRILVCGLNPHAGESGHLGREELEIINPVLQGYRDAGHLLSLAMPADTLFNPTHLAQADAVLAMYHDQGLPVLKSQGFGEAVNITLGLPFIRTSVDHGTALDLAATGQASSTSLQVAVDLALQLAHHASSGKSYVSN